jgi:hypothetical protein
MKQRKKRDETERSLLARAQSNRDKANALKELLLKSSKKRHYA